MNREPPLGADASGVRRIPLVQPAGATGYITTDWFPIRRVGPLNLIAGMEVDLRADEQIDNESSAPAGDPWKQTALADVGLRWNRLKRKYSLNKTYTTFDLDPRRTLPVMIELGVWREDDGQSPVLAITNQGENADNITHHWTWARSRTDLIKKTPPAASYYVTKVRFAWSAQYWYSGAYMEILERGYLSARPYTP